METIVAWTYVAGLSLPLLGSVIVLIRSIGFLTVSGDEKEKGPRLIKVKPLSTTLVVLVFSFLILLALLLVVFFIYKFAVPRYSLPLSMDIGGIILFLLYLTGFGSLFFCITGRIGTPAGRRSTLSRGLVDMVKERVMGSSPTHR